MPAFSRRISLCFLLLVLLVCSRATTAQTPDSAAPPDKELAKLDGNVITLVDSGITFQIAERWATIGKTSGKNLRLTRTRLDAGKDGGKEWDTFYAKLINGLLPYEDCQAQVGAEGWGNESVLANDVHARIYVVKSTPEEIRAKISNEGKTSAEAFSPPGAQLPGRPPVIVVPEETNGWQRTKLSVRLRFNDYGGTAVVDVCARKFREGSLLAVFMYADTPRTDVKAVADLLASFKIPETSATSAK